MEGLTHPRRRVSHCRSCRRSVWGLAPWVFPGRSVLPTCGHRGQSRMRLDPCCKSPRISSAWRGSFSSLAFVGVVWLAACVQGWSGDGRAAKRRGAAKRRTYCDQNCPVLAQAMPAACPVPSQTWSVLLHTNRRQTDTARTSRCRGDTCQDRSARESSRV